MMNFEQPAPLRTPETKLLSQQELIALAGNALLEVSPDSKALQTIVRQLMRKHELPKTTEEEIIMQCIVMLEYAKEKNQEKLSNNAAYQLIAETVRSGLSLQAANWKDKRKNNENPPISTSRPTKQNDLKEDKAA